MRAGLLNNLVQIEHSTVTSDGEGGESVTWSTYLETWASIRQLRGREFYAAAQTQAEYTTEIVIRYQAGIDPKMRVRFGTRIFDIHAVQNEWERDRKIILMCSERSPYA